VRLLLDTHTLLWWLLDDAALSQTAQGEMANSANDVFVSAVSGWEIAIKYKLGKLPSAARLVVGLDATVAREGFQEIPITLRDGERAGGMPMLHKDPFDRMLAAQAITGELVLVSSDAVFDAYGVARLW
jgi:PIN domain nuclease of toxin-antitoxin system